MALIQKRFCTLWREEWSPLALDAGKKESFCYRVTISYVMTA
jgi:hypothetical protein